MSHLLVAALIFSNFFLTVVLFFVWRKLSILEQKQLTNSLYLTEIKDQALLGRISASVIHYMSQPLTVIHGYAQFLKDKIPVDDLNRRPVVTIEEESAKLFQLVRDWMALIRHENNQVISIDCQKELSKALLFIADEVKIRQFQLKSELKGEHFTVKTDPVGFQKLILTVLWEILANSGGNELKLELTESPDDVSLLFLYSGIEINAKRFLSLLPPLGVTISVLNPPKEMMQGKQFQTITFILKK